MVSYSCPPGLSLQVLTHKAHLHGHSQRVFPSTTSIETSPGNVGNTLDRSLPFTVQCSVQVCGHHMALLPSFPGSELAAMWHVANPACICLAFCSTKHYFVTCCSPKQICPQYFLTYCSPRPKNIVFCFSFIYDNYCYNLGDVKVTTGWC